MGDILSVYFEPVRRKAAEVPEFWPILLLYWIILFFMTMKQQIKHMIKHRYIPVTIGKKKYDKKEAGVSADAASLAMKDNK